MRVQAGTGGTHYLDFCDDYRLCSFSVVVFSHDLKNVGDLRQLAGKVVEIRGEVKECDDRAEIILQSRKQLSGEFAMLAPMPKSFDVEQRGHFSAGKFRVKKSRTTYKKKGAPNATSRDSGRCGVGVRLPCAVPFGTRLDLFSAFPSTVLGESREESESRKASPAGTAPFLSFTPAPSLTPPAGNVSRANSRRHCEA